MKLNKFLLIAFTLLSISSFSQDDWVKKDSVNGDPRANCVSFVVEGEAFLGMGRDFLKDKRSLHSYDPFQDDWDKEEDLGGITGEGFERSSAVSFSVLGKAYVGTGKGIAPFLKDVWEFDPELRTWTQKASFKGLGRRQAVAFAIDSFGYVGTGETDTSFAKDFWRYNPINNDWDRIADYEGVGRKQAVSFVVDNKGYVGTGNDGGFLSDFYKYDPILDEWAKTKNFPGTARYGATAFTLSQKAYVATGYDSTLSYTKDVWEYNYSTNNWEQKEDFPGPARAFATSFSLRGVAYLGTGFNGTYLKDFYANETILSTPNKNIENQINVYPTYVQNTLNVETKNVKVTELQLVSLAGKSLTYSLNKKGKILIDLENTKSGIYFYSIKNDSKVLKTGKIIVK